MPYADPDTQRAAVNTAQKRYRERHPDRATRADRNQGYRKRHGITAEAFDAMFLAQNSVCAACFAIDPKHKFGWQLDHDHRTGRHRGILCYPCNATIGHAKESPTRLRQLLAYLEE